MAYIANTLVNIFPFSYFYFSPFHPCFTSFSYIICSLFLSCSVFRLLLPYFFFFIFNIYKCTRSFFFSVQLLFFLADFNAVFFHSLLFLLFPCNHYSHYRDECAVYSRGSRVLNELKRADKYLRYVGMHWICTHWVYCDSANGIEANVNIVYWSHRRILYQVRSCLVLKYASTFDDFIERNSVDDE